MTSTSRLTLHADEHVGTPGGGRCGAAGRRRTCWGVVPTSTRHLAVTVPAERRDAARQLVVVLAGEDRVDDEGLEAGVPQSARLGGAGVDVGGGEGDLARVQQDRLAQVLALARDPLLGDLDGHADELQRLLRLTLRSSSRGAAPKTSAAIHGVEAGVVEPLDERGDARLGDQPDGGPPRRWHLARTRERVLEALDASPSPDRPRSCAARRASRSCPSSACRRHGAGQLSPPALPVVPAFTSCRRYFSIACGRERCASTSPSSASA